MMEPNSVLLFRCTLCSQSFKQKADLAEHMLVHLGQKKHACHLCGKKFFNEKSLELHIKIHATEIKYEAMSTASEQHLALPSQASSVAANHQVKVRVKSFPANANAKRARLVGSPSDNVMHFQLNEEELNVIEESDVYTSQGAIQEQVFEEKAPVQLKVWSNTQKDEQLQGASDNMVGQSSYVIKVQNKTLETPRPVSSNVLKMNVNKAQSQEPIRIFVGSNIRVEDIGDLKQQFSSQLTGIRNEDESQRMQNESVYFCDTSEDTLHHTEYQHQLLQEEEEIDDELDRLKEEMVDGDLQPLSEEMDDLHSLQEETDDDDDDDMQPFHEMNDSFQVTDGRVGFEEVVMKDSHVPQEDISKGLAGQFGRDFGTPREHSTIGTTETPERESQQTERSSLLHELAESVPVTSETHMQEEEEGVDCDLVHMQQENAFKQVKIVNAPDVCTGDVKSINEKMNSSDSLREQIMCSSEKPHKCHICGLGFRFSFYLKAHLPVHSKEKAQYECEVCNKSFKFPEVYNDHLRLHEDQKMPRCCVCSKEHKNSDEAKCCVDTHMQEKHVCPVCKCSFVSSKKLKSHMKTHVEHKCYICDKVFQDHSKLNRHMVSHRNKRLYHCDICNRTIYCLPSEVQRHKALHKNVVSCPVCSMEFMSQEPLLNHMKKNHWRRKVSGFSKKSKESLSEDEINSEDLPLADNPIVGSGVDCENDRDVRRKVASLLIEGLLQDMFEEEFDESFDDECEPLNWLEKISEGLTKEKFIECISKCRTKRDVLREMSFYCENDIIKDAVSDCMLKERICLQKISQMMKASEQLLGKSVIVRKNSQRK